MANLTWSRCVIFTSIVFSSSLEERHKASIALQVRRYLFCGRYHQHAQVLARKDGAQSRCDGRVTWNSQRAAAIDRGAQVAQKCDAGWACLDMSTHLIARNRVYSAIQIFRDVGKQFAAVIRTSLASRSNSLGPCLRPLRSRGSSPEEIIHLLANTQARPMKPNSDRPRLQLENLSNLLSRQFLHIVQDENNAQWRGNAEDRLMQQMALLGLKQPQFRALAGILE